VLAGFLDFERAFDKIWRTGLMTTLKKFGINDRIFDWLDDFLNKSLFQVRVGPGYDAVTDPQTGKRHGAVS
jgi:hypothetical protein